MSSPSLSSKYQIVIPRDVRRAMHLTAGTRLWIQSIDADRAILVKEPADHVKSMKGIGKDVWTKLGGGASYLKNERIVWDK
ncbi:hypothetical protein A3C09_03095 [Candidatus Uhrbacteria bacterium RIFCSPHIGHO2_02_FULL_47_44]|uniref:SpoVT-AbrB domain-containing protein n=1 Tax=Candidatus Uhrbacteria bacterium RIFCSPLOWO2_02_FULL_48_18 TaxID=1802408 RepID=A0A1F7V816_9BACT|nr:MAG: hypothetical protein A2839_01710 [Candidatus Uhrbacteria bacterium RIFCSPHIGHO2_01_FULL_47_10]OGL70898.1 MAG: hypothetical protein A3C09_03095 [Candidatus Uhrbacteria bacterium RIFCSPHIGHO2_02_FULL_47_44]OGL77558.1 MAG: hypothetical protein A3E97_02720 [Candidatus Uhrbacteria bacterium RIFCSPHIGHO2_12_FULL_47_12]OGL80777.1 MAG: hypothetical protein A3B20_05325 [Candidatus Uhrbacteria bacterium RIFCSPLOWO2_01_FULL_47_17]OGL86571.1 MAG: hypothetical protein A3I41_04775 [Candidatus Uhrbact